VNQRCAIITLPLKKQNADSADVKIYWPISNLTFMSKVVEWLLCRQLVAYLNKHTLLPSLQSAYRRSGAQPRLKSWGDQGLVKGQAGCWVRWVPLWGSGVSPPGKFLKTQILNPAFWWLPVVKFLAFWKLRPRSWGNQYIVCPTQPKSLGD